jgi:FKBP-type peptidyl-prolyl cis-trans isomerase FkpA
MERTFRIVRTVAIVALAGASGLQAISCKRVEELDATRDPPRSTSSVSAAPEPATVVVENGKLVLKGGFSAEPVGTPGPQVKFVDDRVGTGAMANEGLMVKVRYACRLENGEVVESSPEGAPFAFTLGERAVMEGWDTGIPGMRVGGKRTLSVPPNRAYGSAGKPPKIPPDARLICDIELVDVTQP